MSLQIVKQNIKKMNVDAMVSTSDVSEKHVASKHIFIVNVPTWEGGLKGEADVVGQCYRAALNKAVELECESIAIPLLATSRDGYPKELASDIAIKEIDHFLLTNDLLVYLVVEDRNDIDTTSVIYQDINDSLAEELDKMSMHVPLGVFAKKRDDVVYASMENGEEELDYLIDIDDKIKNRGQTFQEYLFHLINKKNLNEVDVYKKANIDRKHFSKIRSDENYHPSKQTAVAFAIALELNVDETIDLLKTAGYALNDSDPFDIIVRCCIENEIKSIHEINFILFEYKQPTLGA